MVPESYWGFEPLFTPIGGLELVLLNINVLNTNLTRIFNFFFLDFLRFRFFFCLRFNHKKPNGETNLELVWFKCRICTKLTKMTSHKFGLPFPPPIVKWTVMPLIRRVSIFPLQDFIAPAWDLMPYLQARVTGIALRASKSTNGSFIFKQILNLEWWNS